MKKVKTKMVVISGTNLRAKIDRPDLPEESHFIEMGKSFILGVDPSDKDHPIIFLKKGKGPHKEVGILDLESEAPNNYGFCRFLPYFP